MRRSTLLAIAAAAVVLTACGGDDDDNNSVASSPPPASASQTTGGFIDYLKALVATAPDDLAPVDVSSVTPPTSETEAPVAIN